MEYALVTVPAAPVRRKPRHRAEMINQLLFGEAVKILKTKDAHWIKVRSLYDSYEGWLTYNMIRPVAKNLLREQPVKLAGELLAPLQTGDQTMHIPLGSSLRIVEGDNTIHYHGTLIDTAKLIPGSEMVKTIAVRWLNAPYLWGGRTLLGVDCSGFVQVVFKLIGISLPRDAWQQAQEGHPVKKLKDALTGDLAFFDDRDEIVHVGMMIGNDQIIHASGQVRIDKIDKEGIINTETGKRTHRLRAVKRYW